MRKSYHKATNTAIYLETLTPSKRIDYDIPFKRWYNRNASLKHLKPFGCSVVLLIQNHIGKFNETGSEGIFLGYGETHQAYRIVHMGTVLNETDTEFNNPIPVHSNEVPISNTPEITTEEPIDLHLLSLPNQNPQVTNHDIPVQKGYSWIPEHKIKTFKEIIVNVGDPKNILNHSRQPKHHANLADHLSLDPKTYFQALNRPDGEEWLKAINLELKNMANHQVCSPTIK
ncbi:hypothetical protein O181_010244 [Austropuccinia psidii MF-1]|uniref:Retrovirus-related Pol polyprotein from transposon TNT 1-94 n=1 Tax=Austropuccinia psidii MF-1 TaxID=1389203 RepID=A0A9Q3GKN3_9BASI|nr:hypothetical protein [Austropuccinia psidii MF-1]